MYSSGLARWYNLRLWRCVLNFCYQFFFHLRSWLCRDLRVMLGWECSLDCCEKSREEISRKSDIASHPPGLLVITLVTCWRWAPKNHEKWDLWSRALYVEKNILWALTNTCTPTPLLRHPFWLGAGFNFSSSPSRLWLLPFFVTKLVAFCSSELQGILTRVGGAGKVGESCIHCNGGSHFT